MKRYLLLIISTCLIGVLFYLSSIYLVKAELSLQQLAEKREDMEAQFPFEIEIREEEEIATKPAPTEQPKLEPEKPAETKPQTKPIKSETFEIPKGAIPIAPQPKEVALPETHTGPILISMDFENAKLKDVLKIFCQQSGLNFIAGENVKLKAITLYLNKVTVQDALDSIIKANGLTYERQEDSDIFIVKESGEPQIVLETKIYKLKYAFAEDRTLMKIGDDVAETIKGIKEIIEKLLTPNGSLTIDERTNSIIITDIPSRFALIDRAIAGLDCLLPQVIIEARIVELTTSDLDQLGVNWSSLAGYTIGFRSPSRTYSSNRQGGQARSDQYSTTSKDSNQFDRVISPSGTLETTTIDLDLSNDRSLTDTFTRTLLKGDLRSAILSADDFELTLSLLLTDTNTDIISCPNIVTEHAKEAKITVGEEYPIPSFAWNDDTASWEVQGFEYKDIGILLRVIPFATRKDKNITLEVHPEISNISGFSNFQGIQIPIIATKQATTKVAISDGETLAIGGLIQTRDTSTEIKVPVLGDIPVLGRLFKHKEATKVKTNTIIFITPHIMEKGKLPTDLSSEVNIQKSMVIPSSTVIGTETLQKPQPETETTKESKTTAADKSAASTKTTSEQTKAYNFKHR